MENYQQEPKRTTAPVWIDCYKKYLEPTFRKDQIILFFDTPPSEEDVKKLKESFIRDGITGPIQVRECKDCGSGLKYIQLWNAKDIHTVISTEGVRATTGVSTGARTVGEHGESYSLNFINNTPFD